MTYPHLLPLPRRTHYPASRDVTATAHLFHGDSMTRHILVFFRSAGVHYQQVGRTYAGANRPLDSILYANDTFGGARHGDGDGARRTSHVTRRVRMARRRASRDDGRASERGGSIAPPHRQTATQRSRKLRFGAFDRLDVQHWRFIPTGHKRRFVTSSDMSLRGTFDWRLHSRSGSRSIHQEKGPFISPSFSSCDHLPRHVRLAAARRRRHLLCAFEVTMTRHRTMMMWHRTER